MLKKLKTLEIVKTEEVKEKDDAETNYTCIIIKI